MSSFFTTSATDNSAFTVVPGLASGPELPSADQVAIIRQIHMNFVDQHVKELEAARQEKEVEVKSVTEKMEREMEERDEINKRNTEYLRQFWNEARSGRKAEADRAFLLDANLAKKTEECNGLTARVAALKKTLACVNQDNVKLSQSEAKAKKDQEEVNQEIAALKKNVSFQKIAIGLQVLVLGIVVARKHL